MEDSGTENKPGRPGIMWSKEFGPFLTLGIQLAITVVVCFFIGRWLDSVFNTAPWLMIAGLALGITGGLMSFFRTAIAAGKEQDREAAERKKEIHGDH
jgi:F0F1-type ATP synthase assembly protein I